MISEDGLNRRIMNENREEGPIDGRIKFDGFVKSRLPGESRGPEEL